MRSLSNHQYVVLPTRRSTAEAFQILISHTLGDAGSPYLIGLVRTFVSHQNTHRIFVLTAITIPTHRQISEAIKASLSAATADDTNDDVEHNFRSLQYALFTTTFVEVLGGVFFLITAMYILRDKSRAEKAVAGM